MVVLRGLFSLSELSRSFCRTHTNDDVKIWVQGAREAGEIAGDRFSYRWNKGRLETSVNRYTRAFHPRNIYATSNTERGAHALTAA